MSELYLQPTPVAQWHALVNEAQLGCDVELGEELESYLVFMLMRFSDTREPSKFGFQTSRREKGSLAPFPG